MNTIDLLSRADDSQLSARGGLCLGIYAAQWLKVSFGSYLWCDILDQDDVEGTSQDAFLTSRLIGHCMWFVLWFLL